MISIKSKREIDIIRKASGIIKEVFSEIEKNIRPGMSTLELDEKASQTITKNKAACAFNGYRGFPANICASINEEVVHGIPSKRKLKEGDIVSIDVGVKFEGYYSDAARTYAVGEISEGTRKLIDVTRESFWKGIKGIKSGSRLGDLSSQIQRYVEAEGFSVVRDFVGHGIGSQMHEEPQIPNYGKKGKGVKLESGMVLAVEPMVNAGTWKVRLLSNGWTVVTFDGKLSAHYENTLVINDEGVEVLT